MAWTRVSYRDENVGEGDAVRTLPQVYNQGDPEPRYVHNHHAPNELASRSQNSLERFVAYVFYLGCILQRQETQSHWTCKGNVLWGEWEATALHVLS